MQRLRVLRPPLWNGRSLGLLIGTHGRLSSGPSTCRRSAGPRQHPGKRSSSARSSPMVNSTLAAAAFCSRYVTRLVPGMGTMSLPWCRTQASASWLVVTSFSAGVWSPQSPSCGPKIGKPERDRAVLGAQTGGRNRRWPPRPLTRGCWRPPRAGWRSWSLRPIGRRMASLCRDVRSSTYHVRKPSALSVCMKRSAARVLTSVAHKVPRVQSMATTDLTVLIRRGLIRRTTGVRFSVRALSTAESHGALHKEAR
ncbi:MAG: hypothetical protein QOK16_4170 [Solirubrobacteraceae bacterium]|jgi:hypothetical protein|nr:hypothetical protein [Solirubrobacteraceae bacterium]